MSLVDQYQVNVQSPCPTSVVVTKASDTYWNGSGGVFNSATLIKLPADGWMIIGFVQDTSSPCHPTAVFDKDAASASPVGTYTRRGSAGTATVIEA